MNFEVNTKTKTITLLNECTFKELNDLKDWIGEDYEQWRLVMKFPDVTTYPWIVPPIMYGEPYRPIDPLYPYQVTCSGDNLQISLDMKQGGISQLPSISSLTPQS